MVSCHWLLRTSSGSTRACGHNTVPLWHTRSPVSTLSSRHHNHTPAAAHLHYTHVVRDLLHSPQPEPASGPCGARFQRCQHCIEPPPCPPAGAPPRTAGGGTVNLYRQPPRAAAPRPARPPSRGQLSADWDWNGWEEGKNPGPGGRRVVPCGCAVRVGSR